MTEWWQKPRLRRDEDEGHERKVGFIELFYDLVFVVVIAQVAHEIAAHPDWKHLWQYAIAFTAVWWLWIGNTFYTDRFETQDVSHRVFVFLQMMPVVGLAVFAHGAFKDMSLPFALAFCVGRLLLIFLWWRGGRSDPQAKVATDGYVTGFTIGLAPWVASFFVELEWKPALWVLGLAIDLVTPVLNRKRVVELPSFSHSKLAERFGLFTIIVLGEAVAGTVNGLAGLEVITALDQLTALLAMVLAFEVWWIYFEMVPRERIKPGFFTILGRSYLHLPLLGAIAASGAAILSVVGHGTEPVDAGSRWLLGGSVALTMVALIGLSRVHDYMPQFEAARFRTEFGLAITAVGSLVIAWLGVGWTPSRLLIAFTALTLVPIFWAIWGWARMEEEGRADVAD